MPYNPGVSDDRAKYIMAGGQAVAQTIAGVGETIAGGIMSYAARREEQDMMAGRLESMGYLQDPQFADRWTNATPAKQKGMYADALLQYERKMYREDEMWKMNQKKAMMEWSARMDEQLNSLPPDVQADVSGMAQDYLVGAQEGLTPDQNFLQKLFSLPKRGIDTFMQLVGKGMELYPQQPRQAAPPQFQAAPGGGRVMLNPNNGTAQFIPDPEAQGTPGYTEMPAPAAGNVGLLRDGKGGIRVIPGGTPSSAPGVSSIFGSTTGQEPLPQSSPEEADRRLRSMDLLFGD